ncbi:MAG TPA: hypothetical protein VGR43_00235 [Dehalococcoidia bacterium]|jgi:hypothetical protein|nr:hypothetical protein [Dehalococcoidia bacterium]
MKIKKYCGRERLPGGERRWRRLAKAAGFDGTLQVFGWGVRGEPGREQRAAYRKERGATIADYEPGLIRVWLQCECAATDFYDEDELTSQYVLAAFAHELGHHRQYLLSRERWTPQADAVAERYGRALLGRVL